MNRISIPLRYVATCLAFCTLPLCAWSEDLIVESRREGKNHGGYSEIEGKWMDSQNPKKSSKSAAPDVTSSENCGSRKVIFQKEKETTPTAQTAAARFTPPIVKSGRFHVYVTWPTGANATPVHYTVKYANGEDRKTLSQDGQGAVGLGNADKWLLLGLYDFVLGADQYVEVRINPDCKVAAKNKPGQVFADAVRFSTDPISGITDFGKRVAPAGSTGEIKWNEQIEQAMAIAGRENKKIFLYFYTAESELSQYLEKSVFTDPKIRDEVNRNYVAVRLNYDKSATVALQLGVLRAGTVVLYSSVGAPLAQLTSRLKPDEFLARLH